MDGSQRTSIADWVDPYIGSVSYLLKATEPRVMLPHGMAQIVPRYDPPLNDVYWAGAITGFPVHAAWLMADAGEKPSFTSRFDHDLEDVKCYRGRVLLEDSGVWAEYVPTQRCALYRFTFPRERAAWLLLSTEGGMIEARGGRVFAGWCTQRGVRHYYAVRLPVEPVAQSVAEGSLAWRFDAVDVITAEVGWSLIDENQAISNLVRELDGKPFELAVDEARQAWERSLSRVQVEGGTDAQKRTFYTALYRVMNRMVNISEYGRYFSGFDGKVHVDPRDFYTCDAIWDTYRCAHPLQLILEPARQADILQSYIRMYEQCGWLPSFPDVDGNHCIMFGKHAGAIMLDSYAKGLRGFDAELALQAMVKNADCSTKLPWVEGEPNEFDECYDNNGFFPALPAGAHEWISAAHPFERRQCVSVTLEVCYDDWCVAQMADALGKGDLAARFHPRAQNYRKLYHPSGFMRPRTADGAWVEPFDEKLAGGLGGRDYYAECNGWTYTFSVQHDVEGLAALMGGPENMAKRLDALFTEQYGTSKYAFLGQFPDSTGLIGQFCQGNEPSFHIPYLYNYVGQPWKAQRRLREIMKVWFGDGPMGLCGDEDNGAMSAWYVMSAMGFYPVCPGKPEYDIGSPLFEEVRILPDDGTSFVIRAESNGPKRKYLQSAVLNGKRLTVPRFSHAALAAGGELTLEMGEHPNPDCFRT